MLINVILWIVGITALSLFGAWYARKYDRPDGIIGLYVAFVLISNIIAFKIASSLPPRISTNPKSLASIPK